MDAIGKILQEERQRQGKTLKEVSDILNIKEAYLAAIENCEYAVIPGEVFVKGFIRNYGNCLGLDGAALVQEYKQGLLPPVSAKKVRPAKPAQTAPRDAWRKKEGKWPEITVIAGAVLFVLLCAWLFL